MDEFHFYAEPDRGWAWQVPLLELPQAQFVLMSATLGDVTRAGAPTSARRTGRETTVVADAERPVPLSFSWALTPLAETLEELVTTDQAPVYVVHFTQKDAVEHATVAAQRRLGDRRPGRARRSPSGWPASGSAPASARRSPSCSRRGIGVHHAGMLPALPPPRRAARPGRSAARHLRHRHPRRRHQRADPHGALHRAGEVRRQPDADPAHPRVPPDRRPGGPGRLRHRRVRRRPGTRAHHRERAGQGEVRGQERRDERREAGQARAARRSSRSRPRAPSCGPSRPTTSSSPAQPEPLVSRMKVDNAMLINVLAREEDAFPVLRRLLTDNHEDRAPAAPAGAPARCGWPGRCVRSGVLTRLDEPDEVGRRYVAHRRPAGRLRAQPAARALRARGARRARPGGEDLHARHRLGHRGGARGAAADPLRSSSTSPAARRSPR